MYFCKSKKNVFTTKKNSMAKIAKNLMELVGKTPLLQLINFQKNNALKANIFGKLEYFNPAGSIKDRVSVAMIEVA